MQDTGARLEAEALTDVQDRGPNRTGDNETGVPLGERSEPFQRKTLAGRTGRGEERSGAAFVLSCDSN